MSIKATLLAILLFLPTTGEAIQCQHENRYDKLFRSAAWTIWPHPHKGDWQSIKAQAYTESCLDKDAVSPVGAQGIMQIMPGTWKDLDKGRGKDPFSVRWSIVYGAKYMVDMLDFWIAPRTPECRLELAWASYNAGAGNILAAQKEAGGAQCWPEISRELHTVTGEHATETRHYVERIKTLRGRYD